GHDRRTGGACRRCPVAELAVVRGGCRGGRVVDLRRRVDGRVDGSGEFRPGRFGRYGSALVPVGGRNVHGPGGGGIGSPSCGRFVASGGVGRVGFGAAGGDAGTRYGGRGR